MSHETSLISPFTSLGVRAAIDVRQNRTGGGAQAWHEMMDTCKASLKKIESMSDSLVREMRNETTEAVNAFRREANSVTVSADRPIGNQIKAMEDRLRRVEELIQSTPPPDFGPVQKDLRDVELSCLNASRLLGDRLQQVVHSHGQLQENILASDSKTTEMLKSLRERVARLDACSERSEDSTEKVQCSVQKAAEQIVGEVQSLKAQDDKHFAELDQTCAQAGIQVKRGLDNISRKSDGLAEQISNSGAGVFKVLDRIEGAVKDSGSQIGEVHNMASSLSEVIAKEISKVSKQDDRHYTEFGFFLEASMGEQNSRLQEVRNSLEPLAKTFAVSQRQNNCVLRTLLTELARVQQALHVDYVRVPFALTDDDEEPNDATGNKQTRYREFSAQTSNRERKEVHSQTDPVTFVDDAPKRDSGRRNRRASVRNITEPKRAAKSQAFAGAEQLKQAAKEASMKPQYNVADFYYQSGLCQAIARSSRFEYLSIAIVAINAIWLAVDTDLNPEPLLINSALPFIIMENIFCSYFFFEVLIRFLAFQAKTNAFRDLWFVFDLLLVLLMVVETWIVPGVMLSLNLQTQGGGDSTQNQSSDAADAGSVSLLRMFKLVKLVRLTRMVRLLRSVPELIIIVKGLVFAARSVTVFFLLWAMIVYVFAVFLRQVTESSDIGDTFFKTVPRAMNTLLLNGVFNSNTELTQVLQSRMQAENLWLWPLLIFFMALVSLTLMYMLVGVLVDVVGVVATSEKEGIAVSHIASQLRLELSRLGKKDDITISQQDFLQIMSEPAVVRLVQSVGVDVIVLADMLDVVFEQYSKGGRSMKFPDLVDAILGLRGSNPATVKDFKEQIKITKSIFKEGMSDLLEDIREELSKISEDYRTNSEGSFSDDEWMPAQSRRTLPRSGRSHF
eukprot:TRINITY_DN11489_c0_g1_i1.p1 TRINITY_DN11489_c0_g1~~TRINITY_DN11489_c0_g1_i1.p1  ORF type:complete len:901 (-),score=179.54 TRINITY_DN11489_c0_g1_i1:25-2727(-)